MATITTTAERLKTYAGNPALFRRDLIVEVENELVQFGDVQDDWQREDFERLDPAWMKIAGRTEAEPPVQRCYLERSRGHSKSFDLSVMACWALAFSARPITGVCVAGDRDQARILRDAIGRTVRTNPWLASALTLQQYRVLNDRTGSQLEIISADASTAFGLLVDFCCIDEITNWPTGGDRLWEVLASTIAKKRYCVCTIISNAGVGQGSSWQWQVREVARTSPEWHFSRLDGPVASWISPKLLDEQRRLLPHPAFARLWENRWTSGTGDLLTEQQLDEATVLTERQWTRDGQAIFYTCGLDLGWKQDRSAVVILAAYSNGRVKLAHCQDWDPRHYAGELPLRLVEEEILKLHSLFGFSVIYDPKEAVGLAQRLLERGVHMLRVRLHAKAQQRLVQSLLTSFVEGSIELFPHKGLRDDLLGLSVQERASGLKLVADRTDSGHADLAMSFAYSLLLARQWLGEWRTREAEVDEYITL